MLIIGKALSYQKKNHLLQMREIFYGELLITGYQRILNAETVIRHLLQNSMIRDLNNIDDDIVRVRRYIKKILYNDPMFTGHNGYLVFYIKRVWSETECPQHFYYQHIYTICFVIMGLARCAC